MGCMIASCFVSQKNGTSVDGEAFSVFPWTGRNEHFMYADRTGFGMGCGSSFAFWLHSDFLKGMSAACDTFGNDQPLSSQPEFVVRTFECWTFDCSVAVEKVQNHGMANLPEAKNQDKHALCDLMSLTDRKFVQAQCIRHAAEQIGL